MTNDPTQAVGLSEETEHPGRQDESSGHAPARRPGHVPKRWTFVIAASLVAVGVGGALGLAGGSAGSASGASRLPVATVAPVATTVAPAPDVVGPARDEAADAAPDPGPPANPGHLVVSDTHIVLTTNDFDGSFQIGNDGGSDVEWSWSGNPTLGVSTSGGVLAPGQAVLVHFDISWQQLTNGGFIYTSYVDTDDQSIEVTITGTRDIVVNPGIELPEPVLKGH